jgi:simple sugar transport system ATP-binding protein
MAQHENKDTLDAGSPMDAAGSFIAVRDVHKRFGGVHALRGVSLNINRGQIYHLLGENGCGKSTLIKILSGVQSTSEGVIELDGKQYKSLTPIEALSAGIETVYQDLSLMPNLSVAENVALSEQLVAAKGSLARRLNRNQMFETARRALAAVKLPTDDTFLNTRVEELPLAIRQLTAIARAVATKAGLVIMDEPTTSLTRREIDNLIEVVHALKDDGVAVLFVTHKLDECYQIGGNAIVFRDGQCVAQGPISSYTKSQLSELMTGRVIEGSRYRKIQAGSTPLLDVKNLSSGNRIRDVSFHLDKGEIIGFTGLLDSGRNEIALILAGVLRRSSGEIRLDAQPLRLKDPADALANGIGYVPEDRLVEGLFLDKPIGVNLSALVLEKFKTIFGTIDSGLSQKFGTQLAKDLKIAAPNIDLPVQALSGGNQQRVLIGRALSGNPKILLLHGPTVGVDVGSKDSIYRIIQSLADAGTSVIIVSDDLPELIQNCDRILVMRRGEIAAEYKADCVDETEIFDVMVATDQTVVQISGLQVSGLQVSGDAR